MKTFLATGRAKIAIATALISCAFAFAAFAMSKADQIKLAKCDAKKKTCDNACTTINPLFRSECETRCQYQYIKCTDGIVYAPGDTPPPSIGGLSPNPTATPRKGPGKISGLPESHPTPTPKKGPGKTGTSGIGKSSPTPPPNGPVLLEKSGKPTPTPKPTPQSDHHHG